MEDDNQNEGEMPDFGTPMGDMPDFDSAPLDTPQATPEMPPPQTGEAGGEFDMAAMQDAPMGAEMPLGAEETAAPTGTGGQKSPQRSGRRKAVLGVPIEVVVSVGKARPLLKDLVDLRRDSVLTLDSNVSDPVEIIIGDRVIARGELQEIEEGSGRLGVRLTEVADLSQSL